MSAATIPVTIDPEAAELVAELGMQAELEQMLDQARRMIPGLRRLQVVYGEPYDTGPDPSVVIDAYCDPALHEAARRAMHDYSRWKVTAFHPDVFRHFTLLTKDDRNHAG